MLYMSEKTSTKKGFELCRNMEQLIWTGEQKQNKVFYDLRFPISKERLQMYISLKNPAQAKNQLDKLEEIASLAKNDSLMEVLLYTKANYYYTSIRIHKETPVSANSSAIQGKEGLR